MMERPDSSGLRPARSQEAQVSAMFVRLADSLVSDYDVVDVLDHLVQTCVAVLHVHAAGMLLDDQAGGLAVIASSSEDARKLEVLQAQSRQGPCYDCVVTGTPVSSHDLSEDSARWPLFVPLALGAGLHAVTALPLRLRGETVGALGLFQSTPTTLEAEDARLAQAFADVATIGILHQRTMHRGSVMAEQLRGALDSRVVIEQAKGVLSERYDLSMPDAFNELRAFARQHNRKLTEVATSVVQGRLDIRQT